jgi:hypothetical protein
MITLESVTEGMKVFDSHNHEIGKVDYVKLVETDAAGQPLTADVEELDDRNESLIENLAEAFATDEVPEEIQQRLLHDGFVRMDADGIFAADRYILPEQISSVAGDRIILKVTKSDLQKAH